MLDYEVIREYAEEIIMNHDFESMEAILYSDGEHTIRQYGSMSLYEDEIMVKMPLGNAYWGYDDIWGVDLDEDEELRESAIEDIVEDIYLRIEEWQEQEEERKKMEAYFEEERKQMEKMFGF